MQTVKEFKQNHNLEKAPAFVVKTWILVTKEEYQSFVSWSETGDSFIIWNPTEFANVLPKYFKHSNLTSFIRQLNTYGFHKVEKAKHMEFKNELFKKGQIQLLAQIKRKTPKKKDEFSQESELGDEQPEIKLEEENPEEIKQVYLALMKRMVSMQERENKILKELENSRKAQQKLEEQVATLQKQIEEKNSQNEDAFLNEITSGLSSFIFSTDGIQLSPLRQTPPSPYIPEPRTPPQTQSLLNQNPLYISPPQTPPQTPPLFLGTPYSPFRTPPQSPSNFFQDT